MGTCNVAASGADESAAVAGLASVRDTSGAAVQLEAMHDLSCPALRQSL